MTFDLGVLLRDAAKRLHTRGMEGAEWAALLFVGATLTSGFGFNLGQLALYNRFYVYVRRGKSYWAYWPLEPWNVSFNALYSLLWFVVGLWCLGVVILYPIAILRWGRHRPGYKDKPPLSLED